MERLLIKSSAACDMEKYTTWFIEIHIKVKEKLYLRGNKRRWKTTWSWPWRRMTWRSSWWRSSSGWSRAGWWWWLTVAEQKLVTLTKMYFNLTFELISVEHCHQEWHWKLQQLFWVLPYMHGTYVASLLFSVLHLRSPPSYFATKASLYFGF